MFDNLSEKFSDTFRKLSGRGRITEDNVKEAMDEVRSALLEADVHYEVAQKFCDQCVQSALGQDVHKSLKPGQLMIKIVNDELVQLMTAGEEDTPGILQISPGPTIIMMSGLQGSGKTTTCGKLAAHLKLKGKSVMLCAADLQRPAAVQQLETLAEQVEQTVEGRGKVTCYSEIDKVAEYGKAVGVAVKVCRNALKKARAEKTDVLILDTAGRLHINDDLMDELRRVEKAVQPHQIFLVIDAMTGQDAVNSAKAFNDELELDGVILTKFDSDTRGGAALTVKHITGKPIKYIGIGEKLDALEEFRPEGIASRILGMGDMVGMVEQIQQHVEEEEARALQEKMEKGKMSMDDFLDQLKKIRKMGSMKNLLSKMPGIGQQLKGLDIDDKQIDQTEAIIKSMTLDERKDVDLLNNSRRRRIAKGSGTGKEEVSQLVKGFEAVQGMAQQMAGLSMFGRMKAMAGMGDMDLSALGTRKGGVPKLAGGGTKKKGGRVKTRKRRSR